jgi:protein-S-isoprenylcysteine O-methyltransferase
MQAAAAASETPIHVLILQGIQKRLSAIQAHLEFTSFQRYKTRTDTNTSSNNRSNDGNDQEDDDDEQELEYPQFATKDGLGRVALLATILGITFGIHFAGAVQLTFHHLTTDNDHDYDENNDQSHHYAHTITTRPRSLVYYFAWQWCIYVVTVCTFHLLEFFDTAFYNPTTCSADSFLVNHSTSYTAAAISSWMEFFATRMFVLIILNMPGVIHLPTIVRRSVRLWISWSHWSFGCGMVIVVVGQAIRSAAMMTAGESFNHLIQTRRKANHVLITHGIYAYFRHPSYVGFYYWSIGEQLLLSNALNAVALAIVACTFFQRRIPYEEESLGVLFPNEYPRYVQRTYMGIPFIPKTHFAVTTRTETTTTATGEKED